MGRCLARRCWWWSIVAQSGTWMWRRLMVVVVMVEDDVAAALSFEGDSGVMKWKEGMTRHDDARTSCSREGHGYSGASM